MTRSGYFPLHTSIQAHNHAEVCNVLNEKYSQEDSPVHTRNSVGFFPLQLAAREGMITSALHLLMRGARIDQVSRYTSSHYDHLVENEPKKTPFYLALQNGHFLLAEILLAFDANKEKAEKIATDCKEKEMDPLLNKINLTKPTLIAILFWAMQNHKKYNMENLIKSMARKLDSFMELSQTENKEEKKEEKKEERKSDDVIIQIKSNKDITRFLEFAAYLNDATLISIFLDLLADPADNSDPIIRTAGFWTAIRNGNVLSPPQEKLVKDFCYNVQGRVNTINQLEEESRYEKEYGYFLKIDTEIRCASQTEGSRKRGATTEIPMRKRSSSAVAKKTLAVNRPNQEKIYQFALCGWVSTLKNYKTKSDLDDIYAVYRHALIVGDYVVLHQLQAENMLSATQLWNIALSNNDREMALFCFANEMDLYKENLSLSQNTTNDFFSRSLQFNFVNVRGLHRQCVAQHISHDFSKEEKLFYTSLKTRMNNNSEVMDNVLLALHNDSMDERIAHILLEKGETLEERIKKIEKLPIGTQERLSHYFPQFDLSIPASFAEKNEEKKEEKKEEKRKNISIFFPKKDNQEARDLRRLLLQYLIPKKEDAGDKKESKETYSEKNNAVEIQETFNRLLPVNRSWLRGIVHNTWTSVPKRIKQTEEEPSEKKEEKKIEPIKKQDVPKKQEEKKTESTKKQEEKKKEESKQQQTPFDNRLLKLKQRYQKVSSDIELIDNFLAQVDKEIKEKGCCSHRGWSLQNILTYFGIPLSLATLVFSSYWFNTNYIPQYNEALGHLDDTLLRADSNITCRHYAVDGYGPYCVNGADSDRNNPDPDLFPPYLCPAICYTVCKMLEALDPQYAGLMTSIVCNSVFSTVFLCGFSISSDSEVRIDRRGIERFNDVKVEEYSAETRTLATMVSNKHRSLYGNGVSCKEHMETFRSITLTLRDRLVAEEKRNNRFFDMLQTERINPVPETKEPPEGKEEKRGKLTLYGSINDSSSSSPPSHVISSHDRTNNNTNSGDSIPFTPRTPLLTGPRS